MVVKYALDLNLILGTGYSRTRPKTHKPKVLDHRLSSYTVQSQESDGT